MPEYKDDNRQNGTPQTTNFEACYKYVERMWPEDSEENKLIRAESVYAISQTFFNDIIPTVVNRTLKPSLN
jgi:hypothetical protein